MTEPNYASKLDELDRLLNADPAVGNGTGAGVGVASWMSSAGNSGWQRLV